MTAIFTESEYEIELSAVQGPAGAGLSAIANNTLLGNTSGSTATPVARTAQQMGVVSLTDVQTFTLSQKAQGQKNLFNRYQPAGSDFSNLFIGEDAGNITATTSPSPDSYRGSANIGIGDGTLKSVTTGYRNTAIGIDCMGLLTTGYHNTGVGHGVLQRITTGQYNSGFGIGSLLDITSGANNSGYGGDTLFRTTTGSRNCAHGRNCLFENLTGSDNCGFGYNALFYSLSDGNSAFGSESLGACTTGSRNTGFGIASLRSVTTGTKNSGLGDNAGATITTGSNNLMLGLDSGSGLTTGSNNVCIGAATMNPTDAGHVVIANGAGVRRLSFDGSGVGTFPGVAVFETVTRFGAPLRDSSNANRLEIPTGGNTTITSGSTHIIGQDSGGNENFRIDYYRAQFLGNAVFRPEPSETLTINRQMCFEAISNTQVRIKYRGDDGVTRVSSAFSLS